MSDEMTEEAYASTTENVTSEHKEAEAKVKGAIAKARADALKKLSS